MSCLYNEYRKTADTYLEKQKEILQKWVARYDFEKVNQQYTYKIDDNADKKENTDMFIFCYRKLRFALRIRPKCYSYTYGDITIRSRSQYGYETEIDKIRKGYGDYMLYCWTNSETEIDEYIIIDLDLFRQDMDKLMEKSSVSNFDGCTAFATFPIERILHHPCCVVANLKTKPY